MIIAVDFDGTLCEHKFPEIGEIKEVNKRVIDYIRYRKETHNDTIILWTCRCNTPKRKYLDEAVEWCKQQNIPIDYINENAKTTVDEFEVESRKIFAHKYIDDRAINIDDSTMLEFVLNHLDDLDNLKEEK